MPDLWMDVDAAVTVPVNLLQIVAVDGLTVDAGVTYDEAGLDLVWNFVTTAGVQTHTAVTPTDTGGNYDWVNIGHGMYNIEIPASGGATINNDTEGFGWFTGKTTADLAWRGPVIGFRAAALNNALIDGGDNLDVNVTKINDVATTSVTAVAANVGHSQPLNFTGSAGSALVKTDVTDIATAAVSATTAQLGVNVVSVNSIAASSVTTVSAYQGTTQPVNFAGTGASANVKSDLVSILGTVLTETSGYLTAAFKKFFNVATPTGTVNSIPDAVAGATGGIAIVGSKMDIKDSPTATGAAALADAFLDRNMASGTDNGTETVRTVRQALRFLRNKWSIDGSKVLTVTKENDTDASWTTQLGTSASAEPVVSSDPTST